MLFEDMRSKVFEGKSSPEFQALLEKVNEPCDLKAPLQPPPWLDKALYNQGRDFFWDHFFSVVFSSIQNLLIGISVPNLCYPLVLTKKSETVKKAFVRYSMTGYFIQKLYKEDPWNKNSAIQTINGYHSNASNLVHRLSQDEIREKAESILASQSQDVTALERLDYILLENLKEIREKHFSHVEFPAYQKYTKAQVFFSQFDMAMVQSAFFGSIVIFPHLYGLSRVPQKCIEGLTHVWRVTAYYMGVDDIANLVKDDFERTRALLMDLGYFVVIPAILNLNKTSLIMGKNVAKATKLDFHVCLFVASEGYGMVLDNLWNEFSFLQKLKYYWLKLLMNHLLYISWFRYAWNRITIYLSNLNIAKAQEHMRNKKDC